MPQLDFAAWPGQIIWLLVVFAVLYVVLSRTLLPRVGATLQTRSERISGDMAEARRLRDEAEAEAEGVHAQMAEARARAQRTAAEAKAKSAAEAAVRQAALETELGGRLAEAETRIRATRDQAMGQVRGIAVDTAGVIAEKLIGRSPSSADLDQALDAVAASGAAG